MLVRKDIIFFAPGNRIGEEAFYCGMLLWGSLTNCSVPLPGWPIGANFGSDLDTKMLGYFLDRFGPNNRIEGDVCARLYGDRSVMFTRPRFARWRSLHSGSLHITSLVFPDCPVGRMTPLACRRLRRQRLQRPAPHTMLRIVFVAVDRTHVARSVTHSRDASGARTRC